MKKRIIGIAIALIMALSVTVSTEAAQLQEKKNAKEYQMILDQDIVKNTSTLMQLSAWKKTKPGEYPVSTDSEKWKSLSSIESAIACDMPREFTSECSTKELVEYAIKYPFLMDILAFDSLSEGMDHLREKSGLFKELFEREDRFGELINKYLVTNTDFKVLSETNDLCKSGYDSVMFLEVYLGLNIGELTDSEKKTVIEEFTKKTQRKDQNTRNTVFSKMFIEAVEQAGEVLPEESLAGIIELIVPEGCVEYGKRVDARSANVMCPICGATQTESQLFVNGVTVNALKWVSGGYSVSEIQQLDTYMQTHYPSFVKNLSASSKYNCHSYAWYYDSPYNQYWIDEESEVERIASTWNNWDPNVRNIQFGDKLLFYDGYYCLQHSANALSPTYCASKLGHCGVYTATIVEIAGFYGTPYVEVYVP